MDDVDKYLQRLLVLPQLEEAEEALTMGEFVFSGTSKCHKK
jgi:hypothetical protein